MAEGYLRHVAGDEFEPLSAGIEPKGLNPLAVEAMSEIGIDISRQTIEGCAGISWAGDTVCRYGLRQRQTAVPDISAHIQVSALEPRRPGRGNGSHEEKLAVFRRVRDEIRQRIERELLHP